MIKTEIKFPSVNAAASGARKSVATQVQRLASAPIDPQNELLAAALAQHLGGGSYTYERKLSLYNGVADLQVLTKKNPASKIIDVVEKQYNINIDNGGKKVGIKVYQNNAGTYTFDITVATGNTSSSIVLPKKAGQTQTLNLAEVTFTNVVNTYTYLLNFIGTIDTRPGKQIACAFEPDTYFEIWSNNQGSLCFAW